MPSGARFLAKVDGVLGLRADQGQPINRSHRSQGHHTYAKDTWASARPELSVAWVWPQQRGVTPAEPALR